MSLTADKYITAAAELLQDTSYKTWSIEELVRWLNDALDAINVVRPDAFSIVKNIDCIAGSKQTLSSTDVRLLDLYRNMGSTGMTPGRAIRGPVNREALDAQDPTWTTTGAVSFVRQYLYDVTVPTVFWVVPPLTAATKIEGAVVVEPTWIADPSGADDDEKLTALASVTVVMSRRYKPAAIEWMVFRAFERDSERSPNWQKAARHLTIFFEMLQRKMNVDLQIDPRVVAEMN